MSAGAAAETPDGAGPSAPRRLALGLWSGIGLVIADMVGTGVLVSTGFLAQSLGPRGVLLSWVVGAVVALAGARTYAAMVRLVPRSGGEYRFLADLVHPYLGYLAGWASLLVGFAGPIAIDAVVAGSYLRLLGVGGDPRILGALLVVGLTALHAGGFALSRGTQNSLVLVKVGVIVAFAALGLALGTSRVPTWVPPQAPAAGPLGPFMVGQFFVAFAFSGWNAATYAAEEFRDPVRDVPRATVLGCALVAVLYLLVNWVFVANLTPARAAVVFTYESDRVTLAHLVAVDILGTKGGWLMSGAIALTLVSAASAMIFGGPRVYAAMARDGYLPRALAGEGGRPARAAVLVQGAAALVLIFVQSLQQTLETLGAILVLFSALTAVALLWARGRAAPERRPGLGALVAAVLFTGAAAWMLYYGVTSKPRLALSFGALVAVTTVAYVATRARRR